MDDSEKQQFEELLSQYRAELLPSEVSSVLYDFFVFDSNNESKREIEASDLRLCAEVVNLTKQRFELTSKDEAKSSSQQVQEVQVQSVTDNLCDIPLNLLDCDDLYASYFGEGCGCSRNCNEKFPREMVLESHLNAIGLDHYCQSHVNHQHVLLMGAMNALVKNQPIETKKKRQKNRINARTFFRFRGEEVCRKFFMYAFGCGDKRIKNVMKQFLTDGVYAKQHKATYTKNYVKNSVNERRRDALIFIANYAQQNGLQLPGRWGFSGDIASDRDLFLLSGHNRLSRRLIYEQYCTACAELRSESISFALWNELWDLKYPNIQTRGSRSEPCFQCRCYHRNLLRSSDSTRLVSTERYLSHLSRVQCELDYYRKCLDRARQVYEDQVLKKVDLESRLRHNLTHSLSSMHYTIDWFSTISLPYCAQRSPTTYFKSGYKVALFGISIESTRRFILYIIPEFICHQSDSIVNLTLSLLHHFFENFCFHEKTSVIHFANNSLGQAKNSFVMNYFNWRVLTGHHDKVNISYLPSGHSYSWNDLFMGAFKKKIRNCQVNSLTEIKTIAERCTLDDLSQEGIESQHQHEMIQTVLVGDDNEEILIPLYDWKHKLAPVQKLSSEVLTMNHHFEINIELPGYVLCSQTAQNSEIVSYKLVGNEKLTLLDQELPCKYQLEPLPPSRRKYLFDFISPFFSKDCQTVKICEVRQLEDDDPNILLENLSRESKKDMVEKKKQPKCSYCNQIGHRAAIFGKVNCPKKKRDCSILQSMEVLESKIEPNSVVELASGIVVEASDEQLDPIIEQLDTNHFANDNFEADYNLLEEVCVKDQVDDVEEGSIL